MSVVRRSRRFALAMLALGLAFAVGCARRAETVAKLDVTPREFRLPFAGFVPVRFELTPTRPLPEGATPRLFVHLVDEPGSVLRTFDQTLGDWIPGRTQAIEVPIHQSALAEPLETGTYLLTAGLYDASGRDGARWAIETAGPTVARLEYRIATIEVPSPSGTLPSLKFSGGWMPSSPGQDRQVLVRRPLDGAGPATFQFGPLVGPGQVLIRLGPAPGGRVEYLPDQGAAATAEGGPGRSPKVRLRSSCGGWEAEVPGDVAAETRIDLALSAAPVSCDVEVAPNFRVAPENGGAARSVSLEIVAWRGGPAGG